MDIYQIGVVIYISILLATEFWKMNLEKFLHFIEKIFSASNSMLTNIKLNEES